MIEKGLLIVVSGPSGAGKGTLCKKFLEEHTSIYPSVSTTTRNPREGEIEGSNYHFVSREAFEEMLRKDEFLEYANVYGNLYGTSKINVMNKINQGFDVLLEIEMQGARQVKRKYPNGVYIFILPPSMKDLKKRIIKRGSETLNSMEKRLHAAYDEIDFISEYDYYIINDEIDDAVKIMNAIYLAEKNRVDGQIDNLIKKFKEEKADA